ncbi:MAG: tetratricopeptide repeat protein [Acidimicrobiales bacterium]
MSVASINCTLQPARDGVCTPGRVMSVIEATDSTFQRDVLDRSEHVPVVVDLWAPWCGPCRTLGPIIERVVEATGGAVELAKVNVDENPQVSAAFQVQSIPAVYAVKGGKVVDGFVGALGEPAVAEFVGRLASPVNSEIDDLVAAGDEASLLRALEMQSDHPAAVVALARLRVDQGDPAGALDLLARIPETAESRQVAAEARLASQNVEVDPRNLDEHLNDLLGKVRQDEASRQEFLDILETMSADDPRRATYRRALATKLF